MWNALVSALLLRASIVMIDGDPTWPDLALQWRLAEETRRDAHGRQPAFLMACRKAGLQPGRDFDLSQLRALVFTAGSPLPREGYHYVYEQLGPDDRCCLNGSGGTDVCAAFVTGQPLLPVYEGEIAGSLPGRRRQGLRRRRQRGRRRARASWSSPTPMPSMPVRFWNDPDGERYRAAYFDLYPGVWRQGDWIAASPSAAAA